MHRYSWIAFVACCCAPPALAQEVVLSTTPMQAVYEYQLNYQLPWQRYYGGPGLSLGGTMPTRGVFGYSSLNGLPLPPPLGAGVYVNGTAPNGINMPFPPAFPGPYGPGPMMMPGNVFPNRPMMGIGMPNMVSPTAFQPPPAQQIQAPRKQVYTSSPGAKRMSAEQQNLGDTRLREQKWNQAYVNFRNAVDVTPERPEAHFRLGLAFAALKQYASAIREFKRSLDLDPTLPQSGDKLSTIFGADSKVVQTAILPNITDWTREDLKDTDRLFLLGLLLYFDDDPRGSEILEAAMRSPGSKDYILPFLNPINNTPDVAPPTRRQPPAAPPAPDDTIPSLDDIPPAPIPFGPPALDPTPQPPPS